MGWDLGNVVHHIDWVFYQQWIARMRMFGWLVLGWRWVRGFGGGNGGGCGCVGSDSCDGACIDGGCGCGYGCGSGSDGVSNSYS